MAPVGREAVLKTVPSFVARVRLLHPPLRFVKGSAMRHKCSICGMSWRNCSHVSFDDIYAARRSFVVNWVVIVVGLAVAVGGAMLWAAR